MNISFCWLDYKEKNPDGYEKPSDGNNYHSLNRLLYNKGVLAAYVNLL